MPPFISRGGMSVWYLIAVSYPFGKQLTGLIATHERSPRYVRWNSFAPGLRCTS